MITTSKSQVSGIKYIRDVVQSTSTSRTLSSPQKETPHPLAVTLLSFPLQPLTTTQLCSVAMDLFILNILYQYKPRLNLGENELSPSSLNLLFSPEILPVVSVTSLAYGATLVIRSRGRVVMEGGLRGGGTWPFSPRSSAPFGALGMIGNLTADNETPSPLMTPGAAGMPQANSALIN